MTIPIYNIPAEWRLPNQLYNKNAAKFPFNNLEVGEGFFIPNKDNLPTWQELNEFKVSIELAATINTMRTHCVRRSKKGKLYKCKYHGPNKTWVQVWREQ